MKYRLPFLARVSLVAVSTGWVAALYGALYIYATADFAFTGTFWIFGWPFVALLSIATASNLVLAGAARRHLPSPVRWVATVNDVAALETEPGSLGAEALATALLHLPLYPIVNALWATILASAVTAAMGLLEWYIAGTARNVEPIAYAGAVATLLYGATNFTIGDLLVGRRCQRLRLAAVHLGIDPYAGPTLHTWVRVSTLVAPTVLALVVAGRLAGSAHRSGIAEAAIVFLGSGLCAGLGWLHAFAIRNAAADLSATASRLTSGEPARLVTGSTDAMLVDMARAFNAAADRVDRSLLAQNAELRAAEERLTAADRLKSEFMGMMSHELRTPLNVFVGYTEMLLDAARDDPPGSIGDHHHVLERLLDSAQNLTTLVEDTLSVLRLEGGGMRVHRERFPLDALFDDLRSTASFRDSTAVSEHWLIEDGVPMLDTDQLKLRQIVTNLVGNARKFTAAGRITVRAFRAARQRVAIRVEDTGCGIADAELPYVFDLYRQAPNGAAHNGCGIGLYIVRRYCEMLGGSVEAESQVARGTSITVTLPCAEEAGEDAFRRDGAALR